MAPYWHSTTAQVGIRLYNFGHLTGTLLQEQHYSNTPGTSVNTGYKKLTHSLVSMCL